MKMQLNIAGLNVEINAKNFPSSFLRFTNFISEFDTEPDLQISFKSYKTLKKPEGKVFLDDVNKWIVSQNTSYDTCVYKNSRREPETEPIFIAVVRKRWKEINISYLENNENVEEELVIMLGSILFKNKVLFHSGLVIHASAINYNGKGLIFTAPSGTGKSTHVNNWFLFKEAEVLNDDTPCLRIINNEVFVFGTPWSGKGQCYKNEKVPLDAIIVIEQAKTNIFRPLDDSEVIQKILPRCFLPYHEPRLMEKAIGVFTLITKMTPKYHLQCTKDEGSIDLITPWLK